jgi:molybdenum ABC transporter molybdate-binding protein
MKKSVLRSAIAVTALLTNTAFADTAVPLKVFAAGSMTGALTAVARQYTKLTGQQFEFVYGPAGLVRERIEAGEGADVFVSANMAHPQTLADKGLGTPPVVVARNRVCVRALPEFGLTTANVFERMLDPKTHILTSTPGADPGGDYAWMLFAKAGRVRPGSQAILEGKARQLVGGKNDAPIPAGQDALHYYAAQKVIDMAIGYCSSRKTTPDVGVTTVELPPELAITADYGMTVLTNKPGPREAAYRFALFIESPAAQQIMSEYGYVPVAKASVN